MAFLVPKGHFSFLNPYQISMEDVAHSLSLGYSKENEEGRSEIVLQTFTY